MAGAINDLTVRIGANLSDFEKKMKKLERQLGNVSRSMVSAGSTMTTSLTAPLAAIGGLSVKTFADFELAMAKVQAITGATGKEFEMLQKNAEDLGSATKFTASEVSGLQLELAKLGLNPQQIVDSTESILALAQAFDQDLGESAAIAAKTMNAFGLQASDMAHITDVMAKSFGSSALDMQFFGDAMQYAGAAGKQSGASLEEVTAMMGTLADAGISASGAGTALRRMFVESAKAGRPLAEMLEEVNNATNKTAKAVELFKVNASGQALILAENAAKVDKLSKAFENADGTAKKMQATMDNTLAGGMAKMKSALEGAAITIGKALAPMVSQLAGFIADLAAKFKGLDPQTQKFILAAAGIAAAIGPVVFIVGKLIGSFLSVGKAISKVTKLLMANPWAIALAGVIALVGAVAQLSSEMDMQARTTQALQNVQQRSAELAADEYAQVEQLRHVILDTTKSQEERKKALEELQKQYPNYLKGMTIEGTSLEEINKSIKKVTDSIMKKAKIQALEEEIVEVYKEQVKAQKELEAAMADGNKTGSGFVGWIQKANNAMGNADVIDGMAKATTGLTYAQQQAAGAVVKNNEAIKALRDLIADEKGIKEQAAGAQLAATKYDQASKSVKEFTKAVQSSTGGAAATSTTNIKSEVKSTREIEQAKAKAKKEEQDKARAEELARKGKADQQIRDLELGHQSRLNSLEEQFNNGRFKTQEEYNAKRSQYDLERMIAERDILLQNGQDTTMIEQQIALKKLENQKLANAAEIAQEQAKAAMKREILNQGLDAANSLIAGLQAIFGKSKALALAQIAVDTAKGISGAIAAGAGQPFPLNLAAIGSGVGAVLSGIGQAKAVLSGAPAFAEGGMVTGPMMAMVGDNPSGKEAIIPFEKMGKFLNMANGGGGGGYPSQIMLRARGEDLIAVLNKANRSKNRAT